MNRTRLCLWLLLVAVACSKVGADPVAPPAPPVYTIQAGFAAEAPETRSRLRDHRHDAGRRCDDGDVLNDEAAGRG